MDGSQDEAKLPISALTPVEVARVLTASGAIKFTEADILQDIADGAPVNGDGTINLVHFGAWLVREVHSRG